MRAATTPNLRSNGQKWDEKKAPIGDGCAQSVFGRSAEFSNSEQYCPNIDFEMLCNCMRNRELHAKMSKIDLNSEIAWSHSESCRGMVHEHGPNDFCSTDGLASARRIS
ncbi:MAG: hypothetical protein LAO04_16260, partial [Acidobacteriia bacterium]|nr:hypothetical protein [Terriglobia bacterium]